MAIRRFLKRLPVYLITLALLAGLVYAFLPKPVGVDLAAVTRGDLRVTVDEDGRTRIRERYTVSAPLAGRMLRIELKAGDAVAAGRTLLTVIEPTDPTLLDPRARAEAHARVKAAGSSRARALANLEAARASLQFAESDLERARQNRGARAISQQELEDAETKARIARQNLKSAEHSVTIAEYEQDLAQAALIRTQPGSSASEEAWRFELRSPIDGRVLRVLQESATVVTPGANLIELGDPTDLEIEVDVLSADAVKIKPGDKVLLEHWGGEEPLHAEVRLVEPAAFTKISALGVEEQRVWVIADFVDPPEKWRKLGDAYRVEARIVIWEGKNVLKVPAGALFRRGEEWAVFVAENEKSVHRIVQVGRNNGLEAEVLNGLAEGDQVIVHPSDKVVDGIGIAPR